jgi:hypothetical protein
VHRGERFAPPAVAGRALRGALALAALATALAAAAAAPAGAADAGEEQQLQQAAVVVGRRGARAPWGELGRQGGAREGRGLRWGEGERRRMGGACSSWEAEG